MFVTSPLVAQFSRENFNPHFCLCSREGCTLRTTVRTLSALGLAGTTRYQHHSSLIYRRGSSPCVSLKEKTNPPSFVQGLQDKVKIVAIDLADRPAWYKEKVYPENKVCTVNILFYGLSYSSSCTVMICLIVLHRCLPSSTTTR
jgi:hypothetical protein